MKNVLWFSLFVPYDNVPHAAGKTENFYLKELNKSEKLKIRVATYCKPNEIKEFDLEKYGIENRVYVRPREGLVNECKRGMAWISKSFIFNKYVGFVPLDIQKGMKQMVKELQQEEYIPDVIILHWTEILFFISDLKKVWKNAKYIAIEEDVSYLAQIRKREYYKNIVLKSFFSLKAEKVKRMEIQCLNQSDLAIFNNIKDLMLAQKDGFAGESMVWSPYYQNFTHINLKNKDSRDIVFYGAMNREENWKSAIWFIEEVMPLLKDTEIRFVVIGGGANKKLCSYANSKIIIKGYVENVGEELSKAMCMVAPLVMGAGIKVKVLEGFSAGLPILTNQIGIEGIPAQKRDNYFNCVNAEEYAAVIKDIINGQIDIMEFEEKNKMFVKSKFNYEKDADKFVNILENLNNR